MMDIGKIDGFSNVYTNYQISRIQAQPEVAVEAVKPVAPVEEIKGHSYEPLFKDNRSKSADLENISLTYNPGIESELLGTESDINSLDMQKAISGMKKDMILEEYQYFVGSSRNLNQPFQSEDGTVIPKF